MTTPHPVLGMMGGLCGTWLGEGTGQLPGEPPFAWRERMEVAQAGTPVLSFRQRTTRPDGSPFHAEDGWVRVPPELQGVEPTGSHGVEPTRRRIELAVAGPTGILEALDGDFAPTDDGGVLDASSSTIARTTAARDVLGTRRRWTWTRDELLVEFWMATPAHPETFHHLTARLHRSS